MKAKIRFAAMTVDALSQRKTVLIQCWHKNGLMFVQEEKCYNRKGTKSH